MIHAFLLLGMNFLKWAQSDSDQQRDTDVLMHVEGANKWMWLLSHKQYLGGPSWIFGTRSVWTQQSHSGAYQNCPSSVELRCSFHHSSPLVHAICLDYAKSLICGNCNFSVPGNAMLIQHLHLQCSNTFFSSKGIWSVTPWVCVCGCVRVV